MLILQVISPKSLIFLLGTCVVNLMHRTSIRLLRRKVDKRHVADRLKALWKDELRNATAPVERALTYSGHALGQNDLPQTAVVEAAEGDDGDALGNM